jgi:hypothetical protein
MAKNERLASLVPPAWNRMFEPAIHGPAGTGPSGAASPRSVGYEAGAELDHVESQRLGLVQITAYGLGSETQDGLDFQPPVET